MAKRKNAIALFEVITAEKRREREAEQRQALGTTRWWSRGKVARGGDSADRDPTSQAYVAAAMHQPYVPQHMATPAAPEPVNAAPVDAAPVAAQEVVPPAAPPAVVAAPPQPVLPASTPAAPSSGSPARAWLGLGAKKVKLDPDRQEVTLRFRYTTAVIGSFAILVALGLAYVTGRRSGPSAVTNAPSTEELQKNAVLAGVLEVGDARTATLDVPAADDPTALLTGGSSGGPDAPAPGAPSGQPRPVDQWAAAGVETGLPRVIGLNYVIMQVYHERKDAKAARDALIAGGIPCTIEPVPKSWSPNSKLSAVIGTHGFARLNGVPKYKDYERTILAVSQAFAGKSKVKRFDPQAYQWKRHDADASREQDLH